MTRHLVTICFGIALLAGVVSPAAAQRYLYPPGPPYRTCPDTLTLFDVQQPDTTLAPCHPATLDTVWGVEGVITGFDARPSAYAIYMQTVNGATLAWSGVNVFTGATNYNSAVPGTPTGGNLVLGDVIRVYGTTQEFPATDGETEIEGPDAVQGSNDIILRKVGTAPVPTPKVGTTADFNWVPGISAATAEPYEGCLVRINGPLKVARVQTGAGLFANNFLIVNNANPADSVMIDAFTLFLMGAPPLNSTVGYVQGILNQRNGQGGVNSYRIQIRDANDINVDAPPNLVEAYALENNKLRLLFDKNLDLASAETEANYSLGSGLGGSTVDLATLVGGAGTTVELDITSVLNPGDTETITAQSIGTSTCPLCLSPSQTLEFAHGITPLYEETASLARLGTASVLTTFAGIQAPDPASLSPCEDRSKYAGPGTAFGRRVTVRGVATQQYGSLHYIMGLAGGKRNGVSVFGPSQPLVPGRKYRIACRVQEFGGETELVNTVNITDEGVDVVPAASVQTVNDLADTTCDASQSVNTGEDWEGVLVRVMQGRVVNFNTPPTDPSAGGSFRIVQPTTPFAPDTILVSSLGGHYTYDPTAGDVVNVTGILHQDGTFRILPRSDADIVVTAIGVGVDPVSSTEFALEVRPSVGSEHRVRFALPRADQVELGVYDLMGRRMALLASGAMEAGIYHREWNGRDSEGNAAGAGMYFYRLRVGQEFRTVRAVWLE